MTSGDKLHRLPPPTLHVQAEQMNTATAQVPSAAAAHAIRRSSMTGSRDGEDKHEGTAAAAVDAASKGNASSGRSTAAMAWDRPQGQFRRAFQAGHAPKAFQVPQQRHELQVQMQGQQGSSAPLAATGPYSARLPMATIAEPAPQGQVGRGGGVRTPAVCI